LYVTNQEDSTLSVIDTQNPLLQTTIDVGSTPEGVDITADGQYVFVVNWGENNVSVINTSTLMIEQTIDTGEGSRAFGKFITP
jgi:YVTN family beta-propeller protein